MPRQNRLLKYNFFAVRRFAAIFSNSFKQPIFNTVFTSDNHVPDVNHTQREKTCNQQFYPDENVSGG